jgi:hypothetical protein
MTRQDPLSDEERAMRSIPAKSRTALRASWIAALVLGLTAMPALAQPTVNGLFHGDGDVNRYQPYATSNGGSVLYSYYDAPTQRLYVALVVSHSVNDLVCSPQSNKAYTDSAGWGPHRSCKRASDSEFATFTLECAPGSPNAWTWQQGLGCAQNTTPPSSNWVSNSTCTTSSAAAPATRAWNLYALGNVIDNWKSPFLPAPNNNNVTLVPGYPTYSTTNGGGLTYAWEWSMVYEWSVSLGPGGADCGDNAIVFIAGTSHHSPAKSGPENDSFPPPENPTFADWGDLPNSYGTLSGSNGPQHQIKVNSPYLGANIQPETDGTPTSDATGDGTEEDGVEPIVTGNWEPGTTQSIEVEVANAPSGAVLAGWFDWNGDGDFNDAGEFFTWNVVQGTNTLNLTVGAGFDWQVDDLYARFRLFSSGATAPGGSLDAGDFVGTATDGEVEDYVYPPISLPVTLNAFSTEGAPGGAMTVLWQTASETENAAFEILGLVEGEWRSLSDLVQTRRGSSALPQSYEVAIDAPLGLTLLQLVDYDTRGRSERFGSFQVGERYGEVQPERRIDWRGPRAERSERLRERGFADTADAGASGPGLSPEGGNARRAKAAGTAADVPRWKRLAGDEPVHALATKGHGASVLELDVARGGAPIRVKVQTGAATHVAVTEAGVQRVTYEALRDGGLDLAGVQPGSIAVSFRGEPVARWVSSNGKFGPGGVIEFVGRPPAGDDALYIDTNLYQVSVDSSLARDAGTLGQGKARSLSPSYLKSVGSDRPLFYHSQSPTGDPWVERTVLARAGSTSVVTLDLPVTGPVLPGTSRLSIGLGGITALTDLRDAAGRVIPEHNVEVWLRSADGSLRHVTDSSVSGQRSWRIETALPDGWIQPGLNRVELRFTTAYFFSLVVVDSYGVRHPAEYRGPSLDFAPDPFASGYAIGGFSGPGAVAYAEGADGSLTRVETRVSPAGGPGGGYTAELRGMDAARFWVTEAPHAPAVFTTAAPPDLLSEPGDLVVIAGSSFVGTGALDDYVAQRAAFGPVVVDVEDVYNAFGYGMATPSAITDFLAARDTVRPFATRSAITIWTSRR